MNSSLLATKFYVPVPYLDLVERPRLIQRLETGLRGKLILVSAPAGFGKTTLVASWINRLQPPDRNKRAAWLSLDETDNNPVRFWMYFIAALQALGGDLERAGETTLAAFQAPQRLPIETVLTALINDLTRLEKPVITVLDDYHLITDLEIHNSLDFLIEHLPHNFHLVILTREDPPLSLARFRARGLLTEVRAAELRFLNSETGQFFNHSMAINLQEQEVAALAERTEGWITGLRLAALSLEREEDKRSFIESFTASNRFLTDYLVEEVLSRQPAEVRDFLIRTSILDRFCPELCDAVLGITGSQQILRRLEEANLFLVPLDNRRCWYRYHHLFAEFLRMYLLEGDASRLSEIYRAAMAWFTAQGGPRKALEYALRIPDYERAAELIEEVATETISREGPVVVQGWIEALPDNLVRRRPDLCSIYAWTVTFAGDWKQAFEYLSAAEAAASSLGEAKRIQLDSYVAAHRAYLLFFQGEYRQTIQYARQALANLPEHEDALRARTAIFLGNGLRYAGEFQAALEAHALAAAASQRAGNIYTTCMNFVSLAELHTERGQLRQAMDTYSQALEFARDYAGCPDIPFTGFAYFGMGRIYREWNQLEKAAEFIHKGVDLCREWRQADVLAIGLMELAFFYQDLGEYDQAQNALEEAYQIVKAGSSEWGIRMVAAFLAQLNIARGDRVSAENWVRSSGLSAEDNPGFQQGSEYQALARVWIGLGDFASASTMLEKLSNQYRAEGRMGRLLSTGIWQARARAGLEDRVGAVQALREALGVGEPEGYIRSFIEAGPVVASLLGKLMPADQLQAAYCKRLLAAFAEGGVVQSPEEQASASLNADGQAGMIEPLNDRELAVLRLLAGGLTNAEIGEELYLSVNTIRWYASQIYLKLGVSGRTAAAARARELKLLNK